MVSVGVLRWWCFTGESAGQRHGNFAVFYSLLVLNLCLLSLVFAKRWQFHFGISGIRAMHGLAVVTQGLLGEALGIPGLLGAFSPGIPVAVQRNAGDPRQFATAYKCLGPVGMRPQRDLRK